MSGNKYIDMICTPGPYILGAADPDVNAAVAEALANGSFSTCVPPPPQKKHARAPALSPLLSVHCAVSSRLI